MIRSGLSPSFSLTKETPDPVPNVCPLGLCRIENTCPNAPCVDCMRRLGDHMIEEVHILQEQAAVARVKGDALSLGALRMLMFQLGSAITTQEIVSDEGQEASLLLAEAVHVH